MQDKREALLACWAGEQLGITTPELTAISGDASFRRYFRFNHQATPTIAVDAPIETEDNAAFYKIAQILQQQGLLVPDVLHYDFEQGFLLITDLGNQLFLAHLNPSSVAQLYSSAIDAIISMLQIPAAKLAKLPNYSESLLVDEMMLFNHWFIKHHLQIELSDNEESIINNLFSCLVKNALQQPQYFVHRDFHSRNLMLREDGETALIDFQDAVKGPITYDLVSLLKDCYVQWPIKQVNSWCFDFYQKLIEHKLIDYKFEIFQKQFDLMGMQRHIKVLGIFCRLNYRDNKPTYLKDLQLTFDYLIQAVSKYPEFDDFNQFLLNRIQPLLNTKT